jgi:hypothetical protein
VSPARAVDDEIDAAPRPNEAPDPDDEESDAAADDDHDEGPGNDAHGGEGPGDNEDLEEEAEAEDDPCDDNEGDDGQDDLVESIRRRVREVVATGDLGGLYVNKALLADLAVLAGTDQAAFAGVKVELSAVKGFKARDFEKAVAQHAPPGAGAGAPRRERG